MYKNKEKRQEYAKEYRKRDYVRKIRKEKKKIWREKNKFKHAIHTMVSYYIKNGRLIKKPCEICNEIESFAHHDDYSKPLEVRWLCRQHHQEIHITPRLKEYIALQPKKEKLIIVKKSKYIPKLRQCTICLKDISKEEMEKAMLEYWHRECLKEYRKNYMQLNEEKSNSRPTT